MATPRDVQATPDTPLWEVFIRSRNGLAHKHVGSLHAADATLAMQAARDLYTPAGARDCPSGSCPAPPSSPPTRRTKP